jgi:putative thioredoxin
LVADLDVVAGAVEEAFSRLIDVVRQAEADGRDVARKHLVDLFAVVGDDDARVSKARQRLASALF